MCVCVCVFPCSHICRCWPTPVATYWMVHTSFAGCTTTGKMAPAAVMRRLRWTEPQPWQCRRQWPVPWPCPCWRRRGGRRRWRSGGGGGSACGMTQLGAMRCGATRRCVECRCFSMLYDMVLNYIVLYNTLQFDTIRYYTIL